MENREIHSSVSSGAILKPPARIPLEDINDCGEGVFINFHISMKYVDSRGVQDLHESRSSSSWRKLARRRKDDGYI